jgi:FixJ family two-component response regulator
MPGMSGLGFKKLWLRRVTLPVVFLSGHGDIPDYREGHASGAEDFSPKPP